MQIWLLLTLVADRKIDPFKYRIFICFKVYDNNE